MKKKVSLLIPVYGVEKYLEVFLENLCLQTLEDIEFIIVNDASPDGSDEIIQRYLKKDNRFVYIKKDINEGLYKARQDAFDKAVGEFVINLDSDDFISPDFIKELYTLAINEKLDIVVSNVELVDEGGKPLKNSKSKRHEEDFVFSKENLLSLLSIPYATWCRMYKRELLIERQYSYDKGELYLTNFHFLEGVKSGLAAAATYYYRIRDNSMSSACNSSKKLQSKLSDESIHKFNQAITAQCVDNDVLPSYRLFNNLSFSKLNFVSCIYGNQSKRYKRLKNTISSEFPASTKYLLSNVSIIPYELAIFILLDKLGLTRLLLFIKSRGIK